MDDAFLKTVLETERKRTAELTGLLNRLDKASLEMKDSIVRDIGNITLHSCGGPTGMAGVPLILDICYPFVKHEKLDTQRPLVHFSPEQIGTSREELYSLGRTLVKAYASMTYRIFAAYQIDLAAKGYTGEEAEDLAFYLSRKETYFPWYKTPGTNMRKFVTIFDIFDVAAEDVGLKSEAIHENVVRFYQIWIRYMARRAWDSLVRHIISDRWNDHGQIGMLANRISPMEIDPDVSRMLLPDGAPINNEARTLINKKFGMMFEGDRLARILHEEESTDDDVRKRQLRFIRHTGNLSVKRHPTFYALVWGALTDS